MDIRLVVFDLAGTTIDDGGQVVAAFEEALHEHGIAPTPQQLRDVRGSSKREALWKLVPDGPGRRQQVDLVHGSFCRRLAAQVLKGTVRAMPGAEETFRWLRARGIRVALATGFDRELVSLLLATLGWEAGVVDAVVCGDDVRHGRPAPFLIFHAMEATDVTSVGEVAVVGDTVLDLRAGHNAGVRWNVGVLSGAHGRELLESAPHSHLLPSVADFPGLLGTEPEPPDRHAG